MRIVVVTGVSGAGKSTALRALEDAGYYCVDNLPLPLLPKFVELLTQAGEADQAALGVDPRGGGARQAGAGRGAAGGGFLAGYHDAFAALRTQGHVVEVLFLDASDDVLV